MRVVIQNCSIRIVGYARGVEGSDTLELDCPCSDDDYPLSIEADGCKYIQESEYTDKEQIRELEKEVTELEKKLGEKLRQITIAKKQIAGQVDAVFNKLLGGIKLT